MTLLMIGAPEIIFIAVIVLLLFGGKKIPELMKGLGKGVKSFKDGMADVEKEIGNLDEDIKKRVVFTFNERSINTDVTALNLHGLTDLVNRKSDRVCKFVSRRTALVLLFKLC